MFILCSFLVQVNLKWTCGCSLRPYYRNVAGIFLRIWWGKNGNKKSEMKKASGWGGNFLPRGFRETKIVARQDSTSIGPLGLERPQSAPKRPDFPGPISARFSLKIWGLSPRLWAPPFRFPNLSLSWGILFLEAKRGSSNSCAFNHRTCAFAQSWGRQAQMSWIWKTYGMQFFLPARAHLRPRTCPSANHPFVDCFANASALYRGQNPQNREKRVSGSKNSHFPMHQKRAIWVKKSPFSLWSPVEKWGFFDSNRPFSDALGKGTFWTPKPKIPDFGDLDPCTGPTRSQRLFLFSKVRCSLTGDLFWGNKCMRELMAISLVIPWPCYRGHLGPSGPKWQNRLGKCVLGP